MDEMRTMTVTLPAGLVECVEEKVASGEYASASDVVRVGLEVLDEDAFTPSDDWLRREVLPVMEACDRDPSRLLSSEEAARKIDELHRDAMKARGRDA